MEKRPPELAGLIKRAELAQSPKKTAKFDYQGAIGVSSETRSTANIIGKTPTRRIIFSVISLP